MAAKNEKILRTKLTIERTKTPATKPEKSTLVFGRTFTDHMLEVDWTAEHGWSDPRIVPFHMLSLSPAASVLHYGSEVFEGMKAFRGVDGKVRLFRPMMNMARMNRSALRVGLPPFDGAGLLECIEELVRQDQDWIPEGDGFSLYIRPTYISTYAAVGVAMPAAAKLFVILSPVGPYYASGWKPVKLLASDEKYCRAWPGGSGCYKVGGNYALTLVPQKEAAAKGYAQVLWLFNDKVTEVGTMIFFLFWINGEGEKELITCPITDMILPGVTRDSALQIARGWGEFKVSERDYTMTEVAKAIEEGRVLEAFGTGTAAVVSPVCGVCYKGKEYEIKIDGHIGPITKRIYDDIQGISYGKGKWASGHEWVVTL
jgi:branched-chain amino acid aminotransferase